MRREEEKKGMSEAACKLWLARPEPGSGSGVWPACLLASIRPLGLPQLLVCHCTSERASEQASVLARPLV